MNQSLTVLRECADRVEAETIRIRLASEGIRAFISGANAAVALSMGGAGSLRFVRVEVPQADLPAALELLEADERRTEAATPWICSRCHERNERSFDLCWSCSKSRQQSDPEIKQESDADNTVSVDPPTAVAEDLNPYRPVLLPESQASTLSTSSESSQTTVQERADRALRASIIGAFLLPPLLNFYSIAILFDLWLSGDSGNAALRHRFALTWTINLVVTAASTVFWLRLI